ncbi:MAG: glutaminyl-peptide cyclotransferase [Thermoguttaceae bacterium]|nr:glutaminyl-peptide cyclotransferase [Thermoguttaceae bacterium]
MTGNKGTSRREILKRCVATVGVAALADVASTLTNGLAFAETVRAAQTGKKEAARAEPNAAAEVASRREFPPRFELKLTKRRARSTDSYTQGLVFEIDAETGREILYESGGQYGKSKLRKIDLESGKILREYRFSKRYFAEGIAVVDDRIFALTWRERACFVFNKKTFEKLDEFRYSGEGWGLAFDAETKTLAMSDGTSKIRVLDPKTFRQKRAFDVWYLDANGRERKLMNLNELEFVGGELWTNVYQTNKIVRIDPATGRVLQAIDFSKIVPESLRSSWEYVLNGIAFDGAKNRLFLTGKCWPTLFEFSAVPDKTAAKSV